MKLIIMSLAWAALLAIPAAAGIAPPSDRAAGDVPSPDLSAGSPNFRAPVFPFWAENFDDLALGGLIGQHGWDGWNGDATVDALVTDAQAQSAPHSVEILPTSDVVQTFSNVDSGRWIAAGWSFVPATAAGQQYFILLNTYVPNGAQNWSLQVLLDSDNDVVQDLDGGATLPLIRGQWVELRAEINLHTDRQAVYYNNQLLFSDTWTLHVPQSEPGVLEIAALDLYSNAGTSIFWDDLVLGDPFGCAVVGPGMPSPGLHQWTCEVITGVDEIAGLAASPVVAWPNPFTSTTTISFRLPRQEELRLEVYDLRGSHVRTLLSGINEPGATQLIWDGRDQSGERVASGIYFVKLRHGATVQTTKIVVLQ